MDTGELWVNAESIQGLCVVECTIQGVGIKVKYYLQLSQGIHHYKVDTSLW